MEPAATPHRWHLLRIKARRSFTTWFKLWLRQSLSPIVGRDQWLQLLAIVFALAFYLFSQDAVKMPEQVMQWWAAIKALSVAIPIYLILTAITSLRRARQEEARKGKWLHAKYLYNERQHAFTTEWSPCNNGETLEFEFDDAGPNSVAHYKLEFDGPEDRIWGMATGRVGLGDNAAFVAHGPLEPTGKAVIGPGKTLGLTCFSMPKSIPAVVRVYVLGWELFTDEWLEFTQRGRVRCVIKKAPKDPALEASKHAMFGGL